MPPSRRPAPLPGARLAILMDTSDVDVLAFMSFPAAHQTEIHSNIPLECVSGEINCRT